MTLTRHARHYTLIGGVQWLVDWGVLVAFTHLGMAVVPANIAGRIAGALLGSNQLRRYLMMWMATTAVSTWSLGAIDHWLGLQWAWLAKPAVEAILGVVGFVLSRHWVYRK